MYVNRERERGTDTENPFTKIGQEYQCPVSVVPGFTNAWGEPIDIPKIAELAEIADEKTTDIRNIYTLRLLDCEKEDANDAMYWLGKLRSTGMYSTISYGGHYLFAKADVILSLADSGWQESLIVGEDPSEVIRGAVAAKIYACMEGSLIAGVWIEDAVDALPIKGEKGWKQVLKKSPVRGLTLGTGHASFQLLESQHEVRGISMNGYKVFFPYQLVVAAGKDSAIRSDHSPKQAINQPQSPRHPISAVSSPNRRKSHLP